MRVLLLIIIVLILGCGSAAAAQSSRRHHESTRHKVLRHGGWAGAGFAAGRVAGPAGSAAVGATKYRHDLKAGGRRRAHALVHIGGPIAAGVVAGPAGSAGYAAIEHRKWIKRHILHLKPHRSHKRSRKTS